MAQSTVKIGDAERAAFDRLQGALRREMGVKASREDILAAMLHDVTPAQLAGMILSWTRHEAEAAGPARPAR